MGLGIAVTFFLTPAMLAHLGERRYGMWTLVSSLVGYYSLLQFGLTSSVFYYVPLFRGRQELDKVSAVISSAMSFYLGIGLVVLVLSYVFGPEIARFFGGDVELSGLIRVVGVAFALGLPANILNTAVKGFEGFTFVNIVTCATLLLRGGLLLGCIWAGLSLVPMGWALVIVALVSVFGQWVAFRRKCIGVKLGLEHVRWAEFRMLLIFGGVMLVSGIANNLAVESPKQIVGKLVSLEALGIFGVPMLMISYYRQLIFTVTRVLTPRFSYFAGQGMQKEIADLFQRASRYVAIIATAFALLFCVTGPAFIVVWTQRPQMAEAIPALLVLACGNAVLLTHRVTSELLLGLGRQWMYALFEAVEAVCIVILVIVLARHFGITGAAVGMAIPFAIIRGIFQTFAVCKLIGIPFAGYYRRCALGPWLIAAALFGVSRWLGVTQTYQNWWAIITVSTFVIGAYGVAVYFLLLTVPERRQLTQQGRQLYKAIVKLYAPVARLSRTV